MYILIQQGQNDNSCHVLIYTLYTGSKAPWWRQQQSSGRGPRQRRTPWGHVGRWSGDEGTRSLAARHTPPLPRGTCSGMPGPAPLPVAGRLLSAPLPTWESATTLALQTHTHTHTQLTHNVPIALCIEYQQMSLMDVFICNLHTHFQWVISYTKWLMVDSIWKSICSLTKNL